MSHSFFPRFTGGFTALRARICKRMRQAWARTGRRMHDRSWVRAHAHALLDDHLLRDIGMQGADAATLERMGIQRIDARKSRPDSPGRRPAARL